MASKGSRFSFKRARIRLCIIACALVFVGIESSIAAEPAPSADVPPEHAEKFALGLEIFKTKVRPVLVARCLDCHGGSTTESDFNLATRDGLLKGGLTGAAIVPFHAEKSWLVKLVTHAEQPHMPHEEEQLPKEEIAAILEWVNCGSPYDSPLVNTPAAAPNWTENVIAEDARQFWSFQPLKVTAPPSVADVDWCRTPIDRFVLARIEAAKLAPNPEADRRRQIRRLYFDVAGLPPDAGTVEAFVNDTSPDAFEAMADRLLASPAFGERWARHWLDLSRFAESHGFEHDYDRETAYHFRDFAIRALNDDLPYDTFVKWQLAGDEFAPDENLALMATGFLAAGVHSTQITKNEVEKHRYDELDDMLATTGTAMLGLTIGCARCHDHKYDPIPQRDYYQLLSAFTTTVRSEVELNFDKAGYARKKAAFDRDHAPLAEEKAAFERDQLPSRFAQWEAALPSDFSPEWISIEPTEVKSAGGAEFKRQSDGSWLATGKNPDFDTYTITAKLPLSALSAIRLEALPDPSFVKNGPGRASNGNFALSNLGATIAVEGQAEPVSWKPVRARTTFEQKGLPVSAVIDEDAKSAWAVDPEFGKPQTAAFASEMPVAFPSAATLTLTLKFESNTGHNLGRFRIAVSAKGEDVPLDARSAPLAVVESLKVARQQRSPEQQAALLAWFASLDADWRALNQRVEEHLAVEPKPELTKVLVSSEGLPPVRLHSQGEDFFPETFFLNRGDVSQKAGIAPPGYLQVLMTTSANAQPWKVERPAESRLSFRRTSLANWITDTDQGAGHLLARVIVNRLWQHYMGRGIVATPSDFGTRGEAPSDPELLDWLAAELIRHDWQLKPIHRLILMSSAYRQSSDVSAEKLVADEHNTLFARSTIRRLEGEALRDALLAVGESLDQRMYGRGTLDEASKRRSVYFTVKRSQMISMMQVFDAPEPLTGIGERPTTTIAPQALMLMNNPQTRVYAANFAAELRPQAETSLADAVTQGYLQAVSRLPDETELRDNVQFIGEQVKSYGSDANSDALQMALTDFCQVLMCLNEFAYVE